MTTSELPGDPSVEAPQTGTDSRAEESSPPVVEGDSQAENGEAKPKRRRRSRGGRRRSKSKAATNADASASDSDASQENGTGRPAHEPLVFIPASQVAAAKSESAAKSEAAAPAAEAPGKEDEEATAAEAEPKPKRRRRPRGGKSRSKAAGAQPDATQYAEPQSDIAAPAAEATAPQELPAAEPPLEPLEPQPEAEPAAKPKRKTRSTTSKKRQPKAAAAEPAEPASSGGAEAVVTDDAPPAETPPSETPKRETPARARPRRNAELDDDEDRDDDLDAADLDDDEADAAPMRPRKRKMFLSVLPGEQVEVALTEDGRLQEYYVEMLHQSKTKGNIYKGVIHNLDAGLQAAFVNYGAHKNGFLQIDEVHPEYYLSGEAPKEGRYPLIQKVLKPGMEILVQVVKEPAGTKGAFLTTYLSLAGRNFVLTPGREQMGISRKIEDEEERKRLKELVADLAPGEGLGLIVRTVSNGETKASLKKDRDLLIKMWGEVRERGLTAKAPSLIHKEMALASRAVRDYLTQDVTEIWIDDQETTEQIKELVRLILPKRQSMVRLHAETDSTLFERFNLQRQVEQIFTRHVTLPGGGEIVIDHTEALTAIDVNSGRHGGKKSFKDMISKNNLEAAEEIVRQLRLRDIGGQVVVDFVETKDRKALRDIEKVVRTAFKNDRARVDIGRISRFGLMEMVRQRMGSSALSTSNEPCPCCGGQGVRRNMEWQSIQALKDIYRRLRAKKGPQTEPLSYENTPELANYLLNHKREKLTELEERFGCKVVVLAR